MKKLLIIGHKVKPEIIELIKSHTDRLDNLFDVETDIVEDIILNYSELKESIKITDAVVFLISADLMSKQEFRDLKELALKERDKREFRVYPFIVSSCGSFKYLDLSRVESYPTNVYNGELTSLTAEDEGDWGVMIAKMFDKISEHFANLKKRELKVEVTKINDRDEYEFKIPVNDDRFVKVYIKIVV